MIKDRRISLQKDAIVKQIPTIENNNQLPQPTEKDNPVHAPNNSRIFQIDIHIIKVL